MNVHTQKDNIQDKPNHHWAHVISVVAILFAGLTVTYVVFDKVQLNYTREFQTKTDNTLNAASSTINNYGNLLFSGSAFRDSSVKVTDQEWDNFYRAQRVFERFPGVSSVAYVEDVATADVPAFEARMKTTDFFGPSYALKKVSDRNSHAFASSYVSKSDLAAVEGLDLTALESRYKVYEKARLDRAVTASPMFKLATGYDGLFVLFPHFEAGLVDGYILMSFRIDDLMPMLFNDRLLGYKVTDVTASPTQLYQSSEWGKGNARSERLLKMANRTWKVEISGSTSQPARFYILPSLVLATTVILAGAVYSLQRRR